MWLQVVLSFYEKRVRQQWGLAFGKQEERLFWEQWCACHSGFSAQGSGFRLGACVHSRVCFAASGTSFACLISMIWGQ